MRKKPNILLITIDCLRADHLSSSGYNRQTTPNLDRLAENSASFTQCISVGPHTAYAFPGILTSTYPLMFNGPSYINEDRLTLAEALKRSQYVTGAFHTNPYLAKGAHYDRGFDYFWDSMDHVPKSTLLSDFIEDNKLTAFMKQNDHLKKMGRKIIRAMNVMNKSSAYIEAGVVNRMALQFLKDNPSNFAVWVHYMDVHYPYPYLSEYYRLFSPEGLSFYKNYSLHLKMVESPHLLSADEIRQIKCLYDSRIRYVDYRIKELLDQLKRMDILDNTLIIITADHGEAFCEHGDYGHIYGSTSHTLIKLYDELLRVPLIIKHPDLPSGVITDQVSSVDIGPTIIDLLGQENEPKWVGNSLHPLISGESKAARPHAFSEIFISNSRWGSGRTVSCRTEQWKYIYNEVNGLHELYNLKNDKGEKKNLYSDHGSKDIVNGLHNEVEKYMEKFHTSDKFSLNKPEDKNVQSRLKALGYMD